MLYPSTDIVQPDLLSLTLGASFKAFVVPAPVPTPPAPELNARGDASTNVGQLAPDLSEGGLPGQVYDPLSFSWVADPSAANMLFPPSGGVGVEGGGGSGSGVANQPEQALSLTSRICGANKAAPVERQMVIGAIRGAIIGGIAGSGVPGIGTGVGILIGGVAGAGGGVITGGAVSVVCQITGAYGK